MGIYSKNMARDGRCKEGNNSNSINRTKRTLQDPSPKKDEMGNLSANKRQKVDTEHMQDYRSVIETQILKMCIDCQDLCSNAGYAVRHATDVGATKNHEKWNCI